MRNGFRRATSRSRSVSTSLLTSFWTNGCSSASGLAQIDAPYLHDVGPTISETLDNGAHSDLVFLRFLPGQQTGPLRRGITHLIIHVPLDLWRFCLPDLNAADMEGVDDSLYSGYIRSRSSSESQDPEVGMVGGDVC